MKKIKKMKIYNVVITIIFMMAIWNIDVSITTINLGILTNGFWNISPVVSYHISIYVLILCFFILMCLHDFEIRRIKNGKK